MNYLWELHYGGWAAPNIYFLGYSGVASSRPGYSSSGHTKDSFERDGELRRRTCTYCTWPHGLACFHTLPPCTIQWTVCQHPSHSARCVVC
jgi:lariat debranching enzyme